MGFNELHCWGQNNYGETDTPIGLTKMQSVKCSVNHCCVLYEHTSIMCWGDSSMEQTHIIGEWAHTVNGYNGYALGETYTCVLNKSGILKCFGANVKGYADVPLPLRNEVYKVFAGQNHNCVIKMNNKVQCWGERITKSFIKPFRKFGDPYITDIAFGEYIWAVHVKDEFSYVASYDLDLDFSEVFDNDD